MLIRAHARICLALVLALAASGCKPESTGSGSSSSAYPPPVPEGKEGPILADTGFRPQKDGYRFQNQGGAYPRTPPVLTVQDVDKMFGDDVCASGSGTTCKLKPVASEWMSMVNQAMNEGQCEGMAVSSLAFYQKLYNPSSFAPHAKSIQDLTHAETAPLIGYFWAFQMVDPVRADNQASLESSTPISAEATLIDMMKRKELAVIAIFSPHGGHAVTPYSVEDRGGGIHWIHIYDNNWPEKDRHIIIDHNANTWKYELASLNPDVPREPWSGDAETHSIGVTPLADRLSKPECPFCSGGSKIVMPFGGSNGVVLTRGDGKRVGRVGDKIVNEIPGAKVYSVSGYLEGAAPHEPIIVVPDDADYQVAISGREHPGVKEDPDKQHGVAVIGKGSAVTVETKVKPGDAEVLSVGHEGGIKYKAARDGEFPAIRLAADGPNGGMHARVSHMQAEANDEVALKLDHAAGQVMVAGGGKKASSFDLKVTHVTPTGDDKVNEQKGIKFAPGKVHTIQSSATAPAGAAFKVATKPLPAGGLGALGKEANGPAEKKAPTPPSPSPKKGH
jgi:hypothetical protein